MVFGSGIECSFYFKPCMKSFPFYGKLTVKCLLLHESNVIYIYGYLLAIAFSRALTLSYKSCRFFCRTI